MTMLQFQQEIFTPADIAEMTGVSVATQSNWRRFKYVEGTSGGWNKWSLYQAAGFLIMKHLSDRGIGLQDAKLTNGSATLSEAAQLSDTARARIADAGAFRVLLFAFQYPGAVVDEDGKPTSEPPINTPLGYEKRYLFALGDGSGIAINSLSDLGERYSFESAALIDLRQLGTDMAARAERPLVKLGLI